MELYSKRSLWSIMDEEQKTTQQSPPCLSMKTHQNFFDHNPKFSPGRPSSASTMQLSPPRSPESPWTLTPLHSSPSPTLLYHCVASLHRREGNVFSIAVSRGIIFTGSESSRVRIWKQPECIERGCLKTSSGEIRAILAYGNMLFTTHKDYKIRIWRMSVSENFQPKKITTLPRNNSFLSFRRTTSQQHKDYISCIAYYHADGLLYTGSWDKTVKVWKVTDKKCIDSFTAHEDNINAIVVNQEDGCLFTSSADGSVKIWRKVFGESSHNLTMTLKLQNNPPVNALALSSLLDSFYLYSGSSDGSINFWEKEKVTGRFNHGGFLHGHRFSVLCLVAIERLIFSGSEDTTIRVWRREEDSNFHDCLAVLEGHRGPVRCLAACLEMEKVVMGLLVYSASLDRTLKVWRVKVFPGEKKANAEETTAMRYDQKMGFREYEMSPVLSPSWVEKKLQDNHLR
ncbi:WD40 repeat [Macleaya cordata]|uniref:WD40 repeat n=1 Tax=Macleaya cordata TaxID=56857 RepID=A0A200RC43_MACCD|nr:WD40 repeat [Macleaya cordata]